MDFCIETEKAAEVGLCLDLFRPITGYGHSTNRPGHHGSVVARTVGSNAPCHSHSLENATHLAGTGVQVLIYMGQMQPASSSIRWSLHKKKRLKKNAIPTIFSYKKQEETTGRKRRIEERERKQVRILDKSFHFKNYL